MLKPYYTDLSTEKYTAEASLCYNYTLYKTDLLMLKNMILQAFIQ